MSFVRIGDFESSLDTCTFLWLAASPDRISAAARDLMDDERNALFLSDVSIWEVSMKYATGKLNLPAPPRSWVPTQAEFFQLRHLDLQQEAIYLSGEFPLVHRDPFDRLLAAQAMSGGMTVVTPDRPFSQLGASVIW